MIDRKLFVKSCIIWVAISIAAIAIALITDRYVQPTLIAGGALFFMAVFFLVIDRIANGAPHGYTKAIAAMNEEGLKRQIFNKLLEAELKKEPMRYDDQMQTLLRYTNMIADYLDSPTRFRLPSN